jgi:hypothetical protein
VARNRLAPLTTASMIAELHLGESPVSPEARRAAAQAAAAVMTPAERTTVSRNQMRINVERIAAAAHRLNASTLAAGSGRLLRQLPPTEREMELAEAERARKGRR